MFLAQSQSADSPVEEHVSFRDDPEHDDDDSSAAMDEFLNDRMGIGFMNNSPQDSKDSPSSQVTKEVYKETKEKTQSTQLPMLPKKETIPSPTRRKSDTSLSVPKSPPRKSDTSLSMLKEQQQAPHSPLAYNPLSNHSPGTRQPRTEIMGMSIFTNNQCMNPLEPDTDMESLEDSSQTTIDSEEALERYARQIRTELRHAEMVELAIEADRAAEAGEVKFSAKPSTYATLDDSGILTSPSESLALVKRHGSYSEGTKIPLRRSSRGKIAILDLREVNDVFPSFTEFHKHVRTHLSRHTVESSNLLFQEEDQTVDLPRRPKSLSPRPSERIQKNFLENLGLDRWVGHASSEQEESKDAEEDSVCSNVGGLLAEHLHAPGKNPKRIRRKVDVPPGLDVADVTLATDCKTKTPRKNGLKRLQRACSVPTTSDAHCKRKGPPNFISPKALFDHEDESDTDTHDGKPSSSKPDPFQVPLTPVTNGEYSQFGPDFMTPARLRDMRESTQGIDAFEEVGLLIPTNSVVQLTPATAELSPSDLDEKHTTLPRTGAVGTSILLPQDFVQVSNSDSFSGGRLSLRPSKEKEGCLPRLIETNPQPIPSSDEDGQKIDSRVSDSRIQGAKQSDEVPAPIAPPSTPPRSPKKPNPVRQESTASSRKRRVKLSIYSGSLADKKQVAGPRPKVLQHSQLISIEQEPATVDSVQTPQQRDCSCILSTASSIDSSESLHQALEKEDTKRVMKRSTSTSALAAIHESRSWNPFAKSDRSKGRSGKQVARNLRAAMDMLSDLSPTHNRTRRNLKRMLVPKKENEDFLHNYLYCSRPSSEKKDIDIVCTDHCQDDKIPCNDNMETCCVSFMADSGLPVPKRTPSKQFLLSRNRSQTLSKAEPDSWFDLANEKFEGVLEHLMGSGPREVSPWNLSFMPPTLEKHEPKISSNNLAEKESVDREDEKKTDDVGSSSSKSRHSRNFSMPPQPLFDEPPHEMSDMQFQLIYGMSRDRYATLAAGKRSSLDESEAEREEDPEKKLTELASEESIRRPQMLNGTGKKVVPDEVFLNQSY